MNRQVIATWRVTVRELSARWILGPAAVVIGFLTMMAIRSLDLGHGDADAVITSTWMGTLVVGGIVGLSLLGDVLSNGRLSFYFTRPFAPAAIFGGKLVGGVLVALGIQALVLVPVALGMPALAWQGSALAPGGGGLLVADVLLATTASVVLGMAAGIVIRSNTRWFVIDVLGVTAVGVVIAFVVAHVQNTTRSWEAGHYFQRYSSGVSVLQLCALIVAVGGLGYATATALARGRTDRERAHAALSKALWPIFVPASGALLAVTLLWL